jgi:hypothetical protein
LPVYQGSYFSIETADWEADGDSGSLSLSPPNESALLRIDASGGWAPSWREIIAVAQKRAPEGTPIEEVSCGPFSGLTYEGCDQEDYFREWLLTLGELFLLAFYTCELRYRDRDRTLIDWLLSTLADRRS